MDTWAGDGGNLSMGKGHTDAMKRPKAPPRAKPMTPETAVLPGQDSMSICICGNAFVSVLVVLLSNY